MAVETIELFHHMTSVTLAHARSPAGVQVCLLSEVMELSIYVVTLPGGA